VYHSALGWRVTIKKIRGDFFRGGGGALLDGALVRHPHAVEERLPDLEVVVMVEVVLLLGLGVRGI